MKNAFVFLFGFFRIKYGLFVVVISLSTLNFLLCVVCVYFFFTLTHQFIQHMNIFSRNSNQFNAQHLSVHTCTHSHSLSFSLAQSKLPYKMECQKQPENFSVKTLGTAHHTHKHRRQRESTQLSPPSMSVNLILFRYIFRLVVLLLLLLLLIPHLRLLCSVLFCSVRFDYVVYAV